MNDIHIPDLKEIYNIAVLVKNGWTFSHYGWIHPEKKRFSEIDWSTGKEVFVELWPYESAINEVGDCI